MKRGLAGLVVLLGTVSAFGWGPQGHRLVAEVAEDHLTPEAKAGVVKLLGTESLADVSSWADHYLDGNYQTFYWHFLNIPPDAAGYDRDRDCPLQPGVSRGSARDVWRDCAVDRIAYNEARLMDTKLDTADRAIALKFLVHIVGDLHQPFHALGVGRGGNDIPVEVFGSGTCGEYLCNLHSVWDESLIAHRGLDDAAYLKLLEGEIAQGKMVAGTGSAADWAMESRDLARAALVTKGTRIDQAYYDGNIGIVDMRLEQGGLRLAGLINAAFAGK